MLSLLMILILHARLSVADIVDIGKFELPSMKLIKKFDFFYSDENKNEHSDDGAIEFDLAL